MGCAGGIGVRRSRRKTSRRRPGPRRNAGDQHARGWHYSVRYPIELALSSHFLRPPCPFPDGLRADDPGMNAPHCHGLALHLHRQSHELPGCTTANRVIFGCAWAHEFARVVAKPHNEDPTPHQKRRTRSTRMALLSTLLAFSLHLIALHVKKSDDRNYACRVANDDLDHRPNFLSLVAEL